jgi:hypothetical protein
MSLTPADLVKLQREIQRKVGRNLLRLQQCELLMKKLASEHEIAGAAEELDDIKARTRELVSKKTMGQVVGHLTGSFLQVEPGSPELDDELPPDTPLPWVRTRHYISFPADGFRRIEQELADLVDLRNDLAHHFLEMFDLASPGGCEAAGAYLDERLEQIDARHGELREWVDGVGKMRAVQAGLMNTPEFADLLIHGILPNGAGVEWSHSTVVNLLREAETALAEDGWTPLLKAIEWIRRREPEHGPKKYGCNSWRHLLHECQQFEVRKHQPAVGLPTDVWFRSRR